MSSLVSFVARLSRGERRPRNKRDGDEKEWVPCTKLGRLVYDGKIKSIEDVYLFSMPVKEYQIIDKLCGEKLKDELMKVSPVQKQTNAGQRTRFKAWIIVGDKDGHVGLGTFCCSCSWIAVKRMTTANHSHTSVSGTFLAQN